MKRGERFWLLLPTEGAQWRLWAVPELVWGGVGLSASRQGERPLFNSSRLVLTQRPYLSFVLSLVILFYMPLHCKLLLGTIPKKLFLSTVLQFKTSIHSAQHCRSFEVFTYGHENTELDFNTIKTSHLLTCTRYLGSKFKYGDKGLIPVTERKRK